MTVSDAVSLFRSRRTRFYRLRAAFIKAVRAKSVRVWPRGEQRGRAALPAWLWARPALQLRVAELWLSLSQLGCASPCQLGDRRSWLPRGVRGQCLAVACILQAARSPAVRYRNTDNLRKGKHPINRLALIKTTPGWDVGDDRSARCDSCLKRAVLPSFLRVVVKG